MAPELFEEGGSHSFASDLYAFGCVLYELAAGKPPFVSASLAELMEMILTEDPPPIEREGGKLAPSGNAKLDLAQIDERLRLPGAISPLQSAREREQTVFEFSTEDGLGAQGAQ